MPDTSAKKKKTSAAKAPKRSRKSKAEAMTGAKAGAVDVRQGSFDMVVIDSADFKVHLRAIKGAKEKIATANGLLTAAKKAANKVHPNLAEAITDALAIERKNDPKATREKLEVLGIALRETECPIQISIFDTLLGDSGDQAYKRGEADSDAGRSADNPFPEGSDLAVRYTDGYQHGQAKNLGLTSTQESEAKNVVPLNGKRKANGNGKDHVEEEQRLPLGDAPVSPPAEAKQPESVA